MEGDTARIYRLEKDIRRHQQIHNDFVETIQALQTEIQYSFWILFAYITVLGLSIIGFIMLR